MVRLSYETKIGICNLVVIWMRRSARNLTNNRSDFECFGESECQLGLVLILAFFTQSLDYFIHGEEKNVREGRGGKKVSKPS
jgi:hypothetical protein